MNIQEQVIREYKAAMEVTPGRFEETVTAENAAKLNMDPQEFCDLSDRFVLGPLASNWDGNTARMRVGGTVGS